MKYVFSFFLFSFLFFSCLKEDSVDLAKPETFVRYFNGGHQEEAKDMLQTPDGGFVILADSKFTNEEEGTSFYRVKLIKTDAYGKLEWQQLYPDIADATQSWRGNGISLGSKGGYIVAGEDIQASGTKFLVITTDASGALLQGASVALLPASPTANIAGLAISEKNGAYFLLGKIDAVANNNMIVASLTPSTLAVNWSQAYGAGIATLINKIFVDSSSKIVWGGTVNRDNKSDMRLVRAVPNAQNTEFDLSIGSPDFDEAASGICQFGNGYAMVGTTSQGGNTDILFKRMAEDGTVLSSLTFPVFYESADAQQNETGDAIAATRDGGFILLGKFPSTPELGRGKDDFYLVKINAFGDVEWTKLMGSQNDDNGVAVAQAEDGGYLVLGTTLLANVGTIALIKTDAEGNIK